MIGGTPIPVNAGTFLFVLADEIVVELDADFELAPELITDETACALLFDPANEKNDVLVAGADVGVKGTATVGGGGDTGGGVNGSVPHCCAAPGPP